MKIGGKYKSKNSKPSVILTGLFSLSSLGMFIYLVIQNNKILKQLNPSDDTGKNDRNERVFYTQEIYGTPLNINTNKSEEEELPIPQIRFLTG